MAEYPEEPIRVVVPTAPGTPVDMVTRIVTTRRARDFGQVVVVDNKADAAGGVGTPAHMVGELSKIETQTFAVKVPYNPFGQAVTDLVGETDQFMIGSALVMALADPEVLQGLAKVGAVPAGGTAAELAC